MSTPQRNVTGGSTAVIDCDAGCGHTIDFGGNECLWQVDTPTGVKFICDECGLFYTDYPEGWEDVI